ncbi:MAG TPA: hypothetical protein VF614_01190 [Chthoniobacteraceae bacterium]|jgi:hypothetical protein
MKSLLLGSVAITLGVLFAAATRVDRAGVDLDPAANEGAGTISHDGPMHGTSALVEAEEPAPIPARAPLAKTLVTAYASEAKVGNGTIKIPAGLNVELERERGDVVEIRVGKAIATLPRDVVAPGSPRPPVEQTPVMREGTTLPQPTENALPLPPPDLGIDVHEVGTGKGIDRTWDAYYDKFEKDHYSTKGIKISIRNVSRRDTGDCKIFAYWMGKRLADKSVYVHHAEELSFGLGPLSSNECVFWSPLLASNKTSYGGRSYTTVAGAKMEGWLVVVSRDGRTVTGRASSPSHETLLREPEKLQALIASYQPSGRSATSRMASWRKDPIRAAWRAQMGSPSTSSSSR